MTTAEAVYADLLLLHGLYNARLCCRAVHARRLQRWPRTGRGGRHTWQHLLTAAIMACRRMTAGRMMEAAEITSYDDAARAHGGRRVRCPLGARSQAAVTAG